MIWILLAGGIGVLIGAAGVVWLLNGAATEAIARGLRW
jgi:hypothetical protein